MKGISSSNSFLTTYSTMSANNLFMIEAESVPLLPQGNVE